MKGILYFEYSFEEFTVTGPFVLICLKVILVNSGVLCLLFVFDKATSYLAQ